MDNYTLRVQKRGFTLVELMVVLGIVAVLSTAVILALNPGAYSRQARDAKRFEGLMFAEKGLQFYQFDNPDGPFGEDKRAYLSLPDSNPQCGGYPNLPDLPVDWQYVCRPDSTYRNVDGTGWIPINFTSLSGGSPLALLPIDPVNEVKNSSYYVYVADVGIKCKLTAAVESIKYLPKGSEDGGYDPVVYERGCDLDVLNLGRGLVGYWKFDGDFKDSSGYGRDGIPSGGLTFVSGKMGQGVYFDTNGQKVDVGTYDVFRDEMTIAVWGNADAIFPPWGPVVISKAWGVTEAEHVWMLYITQDFGQPIPTFFSYVLKTGGVTNVVDGPSNNLMLNKWVHAVAVYDGSKMKVFINGELVGSMSKTGDITSGPTADVLIGAHPVDSSFRFGGTLDELRMYDRALSDEEVGRLYDVTKNWGGDST